jgi:glycosyltransferase involved in cell wall biosynthesis
MTASAVHAKPSITVIILAFNEAIHIERCIRRIWPVAQRIVVIDCFSTDDTAQIASGLGAEVLQRQWKNHADQLQWALDAADPATDWVMRIDCDEYLEETLQRALITRLPTLPQAVCGIEVKLKLIFRQRFIRWGGYYRTWLLRLWRTGAARAEPRWMDERMVLTRGKTFRLKGGDLVDENLKDIDWWTSKHNGYATSHMIDFISSEYNLHSPDSCVRRKWAWRHRLYRQAPLYWRAALYFLQRYLLRLGFLDGREGFVWHALQGFWLFVLIDAKIDEARGFIRAHGVDAFRTHLKDRYRMEL